MYDRRKRENNVANMSYVAKCKMEFRKAVQAGDRNRMARIARDLHAWEEQKRGMVS